MAIFRRRALPGLAEPGANGKASSTRRRGDAEISAENISAEKTKLADRTSGIYAIAWRARSGAESAEETKAVGRQRGIRRRGSALLMVLWISAALAAVAFSLANTVRGETDRTSTELDEIRGYYLAAGAVDRASVEVQWSAATQGPERKIKKGSAWVDYTFPSGVAHVELIPETAKLNVNVVPAERLLRLISALGVDPARALEITQGIVARRGGGAGANSLPPGPTFQGVPASFQEIEELLAVRGMTPEIFYGTYVPAQGEPGRGEPRLIRRGGLVECVSVFGENAPVDANTATPAVLAAIGMAPDAIQLLLRQRETWLTPERFAQLRPSLGEGAQMLRLEGNSILTIRATAQVRLPNGQLSEMKRTVAAQVKFMPSNYATPIHILRWYDTTWSN